MNSGNLLIQEPSVVSGNPSLVLLDYRVMASLSMKDWNNLHQLFIVKREVRAKLSNLTPNLCGMIFWVYFSAILNKDWFWFIGLAAFYAWARAKHFGCLSVITLAAVGK